MYDTKFATPVSKSEVTMDNDAYQTVTDPSAYVKFRLGDSFSSAITSSDSPVRSHRMSNTASLRALNLPSTSSKIASSSKGYENEFSSAMTSSGSTASSVPDASSTVASLSGGGGDESVYFLAWTTTPWTLPANMALAVNPEMEYCAVRVTS